MNHVVFDQLNSDQQKVADDFEKFLLNDERYFVCCSPAGTGKTFLTDYLYYTLFGRLKMSGRIFFNDFHLTATTNKAAGVLSERLDTPADTIHGLLKITLADDYSTGKTSLDVSKAKPIFNSVILVDECSMIDDRLFQALDSLTPGCKLVFFGDDKQLPPVKCSASPVFRLNVPNHELKKVMRNRSCKELMELCEELRNGVSSKHFGELKVHGNIVMCSGKEFQERVNEAFRVPSIKRRILAYTNSRCKQYIDYIASLRGYSDFLNLGEYYSVNSTVMEERSSKSRVAFYTDELVRLTDIREETFTDRITGLKYRMCEFDSNGSLHKVPTDFIQHREAIKRLAKAKDWVNYFRLKNTFLDLRFIDASTVHKAQGMTLDDVYIDLSDICTCTNPDVCAKMIYVAFSRAKERIFIYGGLKEKYGKLVTLSEKLEHLKES